MRPISIVAVLSIAFLTPLMGSLAARERPPAVPGEQAAVDAILAAGGEGHVDGEGHIESAEFRDEECTDAVIASLRGLRHLKVISLERTAVTDEGLKTLATCPSLYRIHLGNTAVTDEGMKHLAVLKELEILGLDGTSVSDRGIAALGRLPKLQVLCLRGTRVGDDGIALFPTLFPDLEVIQLDRNQIETFSIQIRVDDQQRSRLEATPNKILRNADTPTITDRSLAVLAKLPKLSALAIEESAVTDDGLRHLAEKTTLSSLYLSGTKVTDAGVAHLVKLTDLERLALARTAVTDDGLRYLFGMKKLKTVDVGQTAVTEDGAGQLRQALPGIKDIYGYKVLRPRDEAAERAVAQEKESILEKLCTGDLSALEAGLKKYPDLFQARLEHHGKGSGPTEFHDRNSTPLHIAVLRDDLPMARRLFELGATTAVADNYSAPPLFRAKSAAMVDLLVEHGAVVQPKAAGTSSALFWAKNVDVAKALIRHGADVRHVGRYGITALHGAIQDGNFEIVKLLIDLGADVNAHDEYVISHGNGDIYRNRADTPLAVAVKRDNFTLAQYLLENGAKCEMDDAPLDTAVARLDTKWVQLLLDHGAKVVREKQAGALLFSAAHNPRGGEIIPLLLRAGLPIDARLPTNGPAPRANPFKEREVDTRGWTALHVAAREGNAPAVRALLAGGIDSEIRGVSGWTAYRCTEWDEPLVFEAIQGTNRDVQEYNARRKREFDQRNEGRKEIRDMLTAAKAKSGG